jgi:hypothetical protein
MSQLSRPYQIGLCAVLLLGLVWMVALRGHTSNPSEPAPTSAPRTAPTSAATPTSAVTPTSTTASTAATQAKASSTSAAAEAKAAAAPTPVYHGAAPGVEGLTRAIAKAHGAVALSQHEAAQQQSESAQPSSEASAGRSVTTHKSSTVVVSHGSTTVVHSTHVTVTPAKAQSPAKTQPQAPAKTPSDRQPQQVAVEHEVAQGKTVILMFWDPHSSVDATVRKQVDVLAQRSKGRIVVHTSLAGQVGAYGSITEVAHVYQTPTILIVNHHGVVSTLTGLTDVFALEQAVSEAKSASA